ncbi:bifunctional peptidase and arginyl-hydroxylase JMJD5 [Leptidea sinapis]|uniref:bifunctional peptidase and arginyl-hydroxylase JMJD5 n=1 Tax=Leptidea sinapis TaxID=189913 RepID=UPI0021C4A1B4|nr:bifunctional peptidase and arginyl-hydroxylase JMJD5 [Leptidea sinapis]
MCSPRGFEEIVKLKSSISEAIEEISELDPASLSLIDKSINEIEANNSDHILQIEGLLDYMYEQVNIGNWKEVRLFLRKTITIASYIKLLITLKNCNQVSSDVLKECFKIIDFGILFGCPIKAVPSLLQDCAALLNNLYNFQKNSEYKIDDNKLFDCDHDIKNIYNATNIEIIKCPSMENFYAHYIKKETPVILDNCIDHWPALSKWKDHKYFLKLAGFRTVSVEIGKKYTDSDWTQKLITIEEFIKNYIYETDGPKGYLAQYQLFDQIPELKADITEPEYCCFSETDEPVNVMAWYGPKGTISPLHHDPPKNLLAQVVGEKQIFLFSPKDSEYLYCHEDELLNNTAQVDPREPDLDKYPKYKHSTPYYCRLKPGQMLYIPPKWWHFVESLSVSFSVSFWWQ